MTELRVVDYLNDWIECWIVVEDECCEEAEIAIHKAGELFYEDGADAPFGELIRMCLEETDMDFVMRFDEDWCSHCGNEMEVVFNED